MLRSSFTVLLRNFHEPRRITKIESRLRSAQVPVPAGHSDCRTVTLVGIAAPVADSLALASMGYLDWLAAFYNPAQA
jgi:hypothetical protein